MKKTKIWAHRGFSYIAPENTMEAFELAAAQKADGIELDIHLTADNNLAVFHDDELTRITKTHGLIEECTMDYLKTLDASYIHSKYRGAKIPTLEEVFDFMKGNDLMLNIELKEEHESNSKFTQRVAELVKEFKLQDRVMYSSFNHYTLMNLKKILPHAKIGILYHAGLIEPWHYAKKLGAECIHPSWRFGMMKDGIKEAQKEGLEVNLWTVDDEEVMKRLFAEGIDGLITNRPDLAIKTREEIQK
ncbi:glycerophosphodiester phosphodiesterase [Alloiococcus sp. CFN-8]|uniref:glycerophosphodiester phosphodiesterase n=1 Tax=Alloiococcus sp. CFN-8 TaxID=3416081 RepID=UPI003CF44F08